MFPMPRGRTAKSEKTRAAIEEAARCLFAERGFERTTVRDIAAAAATDAALVIRYFGSKDELFALVAEPDLSLPDVSNIDHSRIGETLVRYFLQLWEGASGMPVLLRSAASNAAAAERLRRVFMSQVVPVIAAAGSSSSAPQRAGLVASQLLGLGLGRYILKLPPLVGMDTETIVKEVGATIQRYATLD
jgi:AcrR family transcriptional regulator